MRQLDQADDGTYPCETCEERWAVDERDGDRYLIDMFGYEVKL